MKTNLRQAGLQADETGYFFLSLLPLRFLQKVREKMFSDSSRPRATSLVGWKGSRLTAAILEHVLYADARVGFLFRSIGMKLPGLSNYAICRKPF